MAWGVSGKQPFRRLSHQIAIVASVTARKDDAPAADKAAITNIADLTPFSGGGGAGGGE